MAVQIVVADDEPHVVRALSFVLTKEGFSVAVAANGEEALARIREERPRLVFLDIVMPKLTGMEICKTIKADPELKDSLVIILTCKGQELDRQNSMLAGADEFLTKPFSPREVVTLARSLLTRGEA
ncbi:MAG TPA: response regulator [Geobacteraceae bacterium]|nr:response regulator [Geobacteraceae bacterium]